MGTEEGQSKQRDATRPAGRPVGTEAERLGSESRAVPERGEAVPRDAAPEPAGDARRPGDARTDGDGRTGARRSGRPTSRKRYRSSLRSERLLRETFVSLLSEKELDKITVSDVTRRADLNRGTFYTHYENIDALLRDVVGILTEKLYAVVDRTLDEDFLANPEPVLAYIGAYLDRDRKFYRAILSSSNAETFSNGVHDAILARVRKSPRMGSDGHADVSLLVPAEFIAGGLVGIYKAWLLGKYGDIPVERINALAAQCVRTRAVAGRQEGRQGRD